MMVKKTCRKRLTAFMSTASKYSHASPDIMGDGLGGGPLVGAQVEFLPSCSSNDLALELPDQKERAKSWAVVQLALFSVLLPD